MEAQPWERMIAEDETTQAHAAFLVFRDMGPTRTLTATYSLVRGHEIGTKPASGQFTAWYTRFNWAARAGAWDDHIAGHRQEGIERVARDEAEEWERRRQQQVRDDFALAQQFLSQAKQLAMFPVVEEVTSKDGRTTTVRPISPRDLKDAAAIAKDAQAMAWAAINQAIPSDDDEFDPETATPEECRAYLESQGRRRKTRGG